MDDKEIGNRVSKANEIRDMINRPEWKVIAEIFHREYLDALTTLIDHEDEVARAKITAIDILFSGITNGVRMGDIASAELAKKIK